MMKKQEKLQKKARYFLIGALILCGLGLLIRGFELTAFYDSSKGLLLDSPIVSVMEAIVSVALLGIAICCIFGGYAMARSHVTSTLPMLPRWVCFAAAALFAVQVVVDLRNMLRWGASVFGILLIIANIIGVVACLGYTPKKNGGGAWFWTLLLLWNILLILELLRSYSNVVSLQSEHWLTLFALASLFFLLYRLRNALSRGFGRSAPAWICSFLFPLASLVGVLPYAALWLLGVQDLFVNMDYFSMFGAALLGLSGIFPLLFAPREEEEIEEEKAEG